jgi:hypothetical protein
MDGGARSIVDDATDLHEVAAALRAFLASKGDAADHAFATNLEEIALEIDAAVNRSATGDDKSTLRVIARRLRWLAWSDGGGDIQTTVTLLRLATEMEEGAERHPSRARKLLPALAVVVAVVIVAAAWSLYSPLRSRTAASETVPPSSPPAPPTVVAAPSQPEPPITRSILPDNVLPATATAAAPTRPVQPQPPIAPTASPDIAAPATMVAAPVQPGPAIARTMVAAPVQPEPPIARAVSPDIAVPATMVAAPAQPEPPMAQTAQPDIGLPSRPAASVPPPPVAEAPARSSGAAPKPPTIDQARLEMKRFLDTLGSGVAPTAPAPSGAAAPKHAAKAKAASAPKTRRADRPAPAKEALTQVPSVSDTVVQGPAIPPSAPPRTEAPATTAGAAAVNAGAAAPVPLAVAAPVVSRECVPYLADAKPGDRSEPTLGLACRDAQGQWRRMIASPRQ